MNHPATHLNTSDSPVFPRDGPSQLIVKSPIIIFRSASATRSKEDEEDDDDDDEEAHEEMSASESFSSISAAKSREHSLHHTSHMPETCPGG